MRNMLRHPERVVVERCIECKIGEYDKESKNARRVLHVEPPGIGRICREDHLNANNVCTEWAMEKMISVGQHLNSSA